MQKILNVRKKYGERVINDQSKRKNIQFSYENFSQTPFWDHIKLSYSSKKLPIKHALMSIVINPLVLVYVIHKGYI